MEELIIPYNPEWVNDFKMIKRLLLERLDGIPLSIEHVGSTAVPGLYAKPTIDIDLAYPEDHYFIKIKARLEDMGYSHKGDLGIPGREAFLRSDGPTTETMDTIRHHLYVCHRDNTEFRRHINFRDYLRKHEWARSAYQDLKLKIARIARQDHSRYAELKEVEASAFIESVLAKAENIASNK